MRSREQPAKHLSKTCPCSPRPMLKLGSRSACAGQQAVQPRNEGRTPLRWASTLSSAGEDGSAGDMTIGSAPSSSQRWQHARPHHHHDLDVRNVEKLWITHGGRPETRAQLVRWVRRHFYAHVPVACSCDLASSK